VPVAARYKSVSSALKGWYPELESAQRLSLRALDEAEAPYAKLKSTVAPAVPGYTLGLNGQYQLSPFADPTAAQRAEIDSYQTTIGSAQQQLQNALAMLQQAVNQRDTDASNCASLINNASNDSLKDSWWDRFSNWVSDHADLLKKIASILQDIVAVLAIICLLIPGVDLLILAAMAVTAMLLVIHTMLAATGNGNWIDVGLDIVGLVTLGMGLGAADEVEGLESTAAEATSEARAAGLKELLPQFEDQFNEIRGMTDADGRLTESGQILMRLTRESMLSLLGPKAGEEGEELGLFKESLSQIKANWNTWGSLDSIKATFLNGGDPGIAEAMDNIRGMSQWWSGVSKVTDSLATASSTVRWANVAFYSGNVSVLADWTAGQIGGEKYDDFKDGLSSYTLSNLEANILADTGNPLFDGFRMASSFVGN
jgi:hypothetical protein